MCIWVAVFEEIMSGNRSNLRDEFSEIFNRFVIGEISEIKARILCEREFDKWHTIFN